MIYLADAARLLDVTPAAIRKAVGAQRPTIRGVPPNSELNPPGKWMGSRDDVEAEARRRGRPIAIATAPVVSASGEPGTLSTDEVRVQLMQGDLIDALKAQLAEKDARIALLERIVEEKDTRLAERDEQIAALRRRVRALADVD